MRNRLPMIFSITALLVAVLGSTPLGEAAHNAVVPKNSVGTPQLKRNAVKAAKIAPNAVRTGHVLDGSLLSADFKPGQIPQGPKGDKGDKGDAGSAGPPGISGYEIVNAVNTTPGGINNASVTCPTGKRVLGGGATQSVQAAGSGPYLGRSYPVGNASWAASVPAPVGNPTTVTVFAICANVS
jgi:hypothetical protein